jgi:hypothetical protein
MQTELPEAEAQVEVDGDFSEVAGASVESLPAPEGFVGDVHVASSATISADVADTAGATSADETSTLEPGTSIDAPPTSPPQALTLEQIQRELAITTDTLPIWSLLAELFTDPKMFGSTALFEAAGFSIADHKESKNKCMVGTSERAKGYLFKKYVDAHPDDEQLRNYMHRVEGSRLLRTFIADRGFSRVVAPQKWLYELPASFPTRYLVVAERVSIVSRSDTKEAYAHIRKKQLRELATILYFFRGLNSTISNLPFTKNDEIAFIDTEIWHHVDRSFLHKVRDRLSRKRRDLAEEIFRELRDLGAVPFASTFE